MAKTREQRNADRRARSARNKYYDEFWTNLMYESGYVARIEEQLKQCIKEDKPVNIVDFSMTAEEAAFRPPVDKG